MVEERTRARTAVKRVAEEEWEHAHAGLLFKLATPARHIERGVDGGNHRVIGGLATEMCGDRLQE
jgi:hypothetical protein